MVDMHIKNQIAIVNWNLYRLAETLLPLINSDENKAIEIAQNSLSKFINLATSNLSHEMCSKIGIFEPKTSDIDLLNELLNMMQKYKEDYTNTFIALTFNDLPQKGMFISEEFINWKKKWEETLTLQNKSKDEVFDLMKNSNPAVIPRNHRVEEALSAANNRDFSVMNNLLKSFI